MKPDAEAMLRFVQLVAGYGPEIGVETARRWIGDAQKLLAPPDPQEVLRKAVRDVINEDDVAGGAVLVSPEKYDAMQRALDAAEKAAHAK